MKTKMIILALILSVSVVSAVAEKGQVPDDDFILSSIKPDAGLNSVKELYIAGYTNDAMDALLDSIKNRSTKRYYFNWTEFPELLSDYTNDYPGIFEDLHRGLADYQTSHYAPETSWDLPSVNLLGENVTAYELRHLARQQKSFDMTLLYFQEDRKDYLDYWTRQVADLMRAYQNGDYEDAGNGIFEYYRAGRRIHNWMFNHHAYYNSPEYSKDDQSLLLKTFIYHAYDLAERTEDYHAGNHHTKGLVGLFEIAVFLQDFTFSEQWIAQSLDLLTEHLDKEINPDGFQFERSVHYHVGDIENYFRVYQLARINNISVPELFETRFKGMFDALKDMAQPDKNLPVLEDDTDYFLKENNELGGIFKAGALLLSDTVLNYLASDLPSPDWYWLLADMLATNYKEKTRPTIGSTALESTGYYILRNGWRLKDQYMCISAGLSKVKPDHQHGDMLGLTAYANGYQILPTYQVKYNKPDYDIFKNSWVKNVAIVDSIPLGRDFSGNKGGSGFGKFLKLPNPDVLLWAPGKDVDIFVGTHDGFDDIGVETYRTVIFLKRTGEWFVCDQFISDDIHSYQQIWQGMDASDPNGNLIRSFDDNFVMKISQMVPRDYTINRKDLRDKRSWMVSEKADVFQFVTHISTAGSFKRLKDRPQRVDCPIKIPGNNKDAVIIKLSRGNYLAMGISSATIDNISINSEIPANIILKKERNGRYSITNISPFEIKIDKVTIKTGNSFEQNQ